MPSPYLRSQEEKVESITIILDEREVSGRPGTTVLELAREVGVEIPSLCYDSHLSPLGACRVCLVEDEKSGRMLASCVTPIAPGMIINTRSDRVMENRRNVVELMLASHPDSCIVCDKGNRCELRKIATDLGIGLSAFEKIPVFHPIKELNPFLQRDLSKCIRCGRCIRADQEIAVVGAIDYTDRGFESRPATLHDLPLEKSPCNFCGICLSVCPTGALSARNRVSTLSAAHATQTTCTLCGTGCAILLEHTPDRIVAVSPADDPNTVNHVSLCVRGHYGMDFVHSKNRLMTPLIRKNGELEPADWDEALDFVVNAFSDLKKSKGANSLGALGASVCTNEENYLLQKMVRKGFECNNIDSGARLRGLELASGIAQVLGTGTATAALAQIRNAEEILVIGGDPLVESPIAGQLLKQAVKFKNAHLTVVDSLPQGLTDFAGSWIHPHPGTLIVFLAGLCRQIFLWESSEPQSGTHWDNWFAGLDQKLEGFTPEKVEQITGVPSKLITSTAKRLAAANKLAIITGAELARKADAKFAGILLASLIARTGNLGKAGCGLFPLAASLNDQGAADMGAIPASKGLDYFEMIKAAGNGELAGLFVVGENPAYDCPGESKVAKALLSLDMLVVQDRFLTETAKLAHVVLPGATFAEKSGTWTSVERRVQRISQAIPPIGNSKPDWMILTELLQRFGLKASYNSPDDVLCEISKSVPDYRGVTPAHLKRENVFVPCIHEDDPGTAVLFADGLPDKPGRELPDIPQKKPAELQRDYPFWLMVSESLFSSADRAATIHSKTLCKYGENGHVLINPMDAQRLDLADNTPVNIYSQHGSLNARITVSDQTPRDVLLATRTPGFHLEGLFDLTERNRQCPGPTLYRIAINLEAIDESE